jgi:hypothetical protein
MFATEEPTLLTGYETLAASFGDCLYTRRRRDSVECVLCGQWAVLMPEYYYCTNCIKAIPVEDAHPDAEWVGISTKGLLSLDRLRFYFPRPWNGWRQWVTRTDLQALYDSYLKEKEEIHVRK